jgi:hypothetical protein
MFGLCSLRKEKEKVTVPARFMVSEKKEARGGETIVLLSKLVGISG